MAGEQALNIRAKRVVIYNLIPFLAGSSKSLSRVAGAPEAVLKKVRASCACKGKDYPLWAAEVENHCPVPFGHPFRQVAKRLVPGDPVRVLGAWAYGGGNSWITLEEIEWEDKTVIHPQDDHREWLRKEAGKVLR